MKMPFAAGEEIRRNLEWRRLLPRLGGAFLCVALAAAMTVVIQPFAGQFFFGFFYAAVVVASFFWGSSGGAAAALLAALAADYLFVAPAGSVLTTGDEVVAVGIFLLVSGLIILLFAMLRRGRAAQRQLYFQAQLLDSVEQAVIATDNSGSIVFWNRFAEKLYGWRAEEVIGRSVLDVVPAPAAVGDATQIMAQLAAGGRWSGEHLVQRRDGAVFLAEVNDAPIFDAAGVLEGVVGVSVDISQRKQSEEHLRFLADASMELSASLDYKATLQRVCDLVVPKLGSWCAIDFVRPGGEIELVAVSHVDAAKVTWARELRRRFPPSLADEGGVAQVIRTGKSEFYPYIPEELIEQSTTDPEMLAIMREIGFRALIIVPMRARGRSLGALTMVWSEPGRQYTESDLIFAEELATRAAIAVDNAVLYADVSLAERQQAELLAQMEALVANAPAGIAFFDRDLRYLRINGAMAELNGLPVEAHLEHTIREVLPELADKAEPYIKQVFETGRGFYNVEISGVAANRPGDLRFCLASWYPVIIEHGKPTYVGAMVVDITERMRVEAALRESEDRFRAAFEQAAVGMAHVSLENTWIRVNDRLCDILGYTRAELAAMRATDVMHPEDRDLDRTQLDELLSGALDGYHIEKRCVHKDGQLVWVGLTVSLVRDLDTNLAKYYIAVVEDIGERKAAETQLRLLAESSKVLSNTLLEERTLQAVADLITPQFADWCTINRRDEAGQIVQMAAAHAEPDKAELLRQITAAFPLEPDAPSGTPAVIRSGVSLFVPLVQPGMAARDPRLALVTPLGASSLMIVPLQARQQVLGAVTLARGSAQPPFSAEDLQFVEELAQRIALTLDNAALFQDARESQILLRQLNETLELRVKERTAELERSNRELDRFAYVASHDLKAPLRAIDNLSTWLYEDALGDLPAPSQEHLVKLRGRVQRMERLLDDLLAYSRAGRVQHAPEQVDTGALVQSVFELLSPPPGFQLAIDGELPVITTQRVPLETVLRNLIGNAIKHHHCSDGRIGVAVLEKGAWLEFAISDDGPGMAPQYHERIFEMFQTLQPRDQVEGSGMGLAIVKKTVESMGGSISVDSVEGRGTCFRFTWPRGVERVEPDAVELARSARPVDL